MKTVGFFAFLSLLIKVLAFACFMYVAGSIALSSYKAFAGKCDLRLGIEPHINGDWFCPVKTKSCDCRDYHSEKEVKGD